MRTVTMRGVLSVAATALVLSGCSDSSAPEGEAPTLPPLASMQADMSIFTAQVDIVGEADVAGSNFIAAALAVTVARVWTGLVMAVPVATWGAAASATPTFHDGAFQWEVSATENGQTYAADLSGRGEGTESVWEMRVSSTSHNPPLDNYLWYTGRAALSGANGEWHIFDAAHPTTRNELLSIDWTHASSTTWTLDFTNVVSGTAEFGDALRYESTGDARLVRFTDASASTTTEVGWSSASGAGYVQGPGFNGGVRACWDAAFQNVTCP